MFDARNNLVQLMFLQIHSLEQCKFVIRELSAALYFSYDVRRFIDAYLLLSLVHLLIVYIDGPVVSTPILSLHGGAFVWIQDVA
jgi:hypothetical protein